MAPQTQSSIIFAGLIVFLCYCCCGSCNFVVAVRDDDSSKETTTTSAFLRRPTDRVLVFNDSVFNNDAAVAEERKLMPLSNNKCGCSTCTEEVINADAGGYSCGSRIDWMVGSMHYSEEDACNLVAGEEFTSVCGGCHTAQCDKPVSFRCECDQCTESVWNTIVTDDGGSFSCGNRIDWIKATSGYDEFSACRYVTDEFPGICTCACGVTPQPHTPTSGTVKVMSYNTEYTGYTDGRINDFAQKIAEVAADVVGLQECQDPNTLARLAGYTLLPDTGNQNYILYNANRLQQLESGSMNIPRDDYSQRTITWGKFLFLEGSGAGNAFWFFNTHLPHNHNEAVDRNTHAKIGRMLLAKRIELGAGSSPTIVVGDCNPSASSGAPDGSFESNLAQGGIRWIYTGTGIETATGIVGGNPAHDKIFASEEWTGSGADVGTGSSDHPAITADLTL